MPLTLRQQIIVTLTGGMYSAYDLATLHAISEREIEDHLSHIARSLARDTTRQIIREPAECEQCEFTFRNRARFTRPSRCPKCRSERICAPKFGIRLRL
jgi:predicted Zn-ribbon and HTH transcriptional regulator